MELDFYNYDDGEFIASVYLDVDIVDRLAKIATENGYSTDEYIIQIFRDKIDNLSPLQIED